MSILAQWIDYNHKMEKFYAAQGMSKVERFRKELDPIYTNFILNRKYFLCLYPTGDLRALQARIDKIDSWLSKHSVSCNEIWKMIYKIQKALTPGIFAATLVTVTKASRPTHSMPSTLLSEPSTSCSFRASPVDYPPIPDCLKKWKTIAKWILFSDVIQKILTTSGISEQERYCNEIIFIYNTFLPEGDSILNQYQVEDVSKLESRFKRINLWVSKHCLNSDIILINAQIELAFIQYNQKNIKDGLKKFKSPSVSSLPEPSTSYSSITPLVTAPASIVKTTASTSSRTVITKKISKAPAKKRNNFVDVSPYIARVNRLVTSGKFVHSIDRSNGLPALQRLINVLNELGKINFVNPQVGFTFRLNNSLNQLEAASSYGSLGSTEIKELYKDLEDVLRFQGKIAHEEDLKVEEVSSPDIELLLQPSWSEISESSGGIPLSILYRLAPADAIAKGYIPPQDPPYEPGPRGPPGSAGIAR